jgi:Virulence factor BrkB
MAATGGSTSPGSLAFSAQPSVTVAVSDRAARQLHVLTPGQLPDRAALRDRQKATLPHWRKWWTMHFLLAGRASWHALIRPALVTAVLWLALAVFSSISLSSSIVSDSKLYGTIGVVFTLLTWFILVATVLVLGAAFGAVWQKRKGQGFRPPDSDARPGGVAETEHA